MKNISEVLLSNNVFQNLICKTNDKRQKVIFIIGATGIGKSRLAVDLACNLKTEILNTDSMQIYRDFNIASAKINEEEMKGVKHHLLSIIDVEQSNFSVNNYLPLALEKIEELHSNNKIPIIAGGTLYWVEALLWENYLSQNAIGTNSNISKNEINNLNTIKDELFTYEKLKLIDPLMANRLHPNDKRKIKRSIEVQEKSGCKLRHSDLLKITGGNRGTRQTPRYDSIILQLDCKSSKELDTKLDERVDKMVEEGLFDEIASISSKLEKNKMHTKINICVGNNYESGVEQAIGYKELQPYFDALKNSNNNDEHNLKLIGDKSIESIKRRTRRYVRRQLSQIYNRLLPIHFDKLPVFRIEVPIGENPQLCVDKKSFNTNNCLDLSFNSQNFDELQNQHVFKPSLSIIEAFVTNKLNSNPAIDYEVFNNNCDIFNYIANKNIDDNLKNSQNSINSCENLDNQQKFKCEICSRTLNGEHEQQIHLSSRKHKKRYSSHKKRKLREKMLLANTEKSLLIKD